MNRIRAGRCGALVSVLIASPVSAEALLDTGAGNLGGNALSEEQFLAVGLSSEHEATITHVEGWIAASTPGAVTIVLYTEEDNKPAVPIQSATFVVESSRPDRFGVSGLDWTLPAQKSHWIAFEVHDSSFVGYMAGASDPSNKEAYCIVERNEWRTEGGGRLSLGVRVIGAPRSSAASH
jgi:hypothetical protein